VLGADAQRGLSEDEARARLERYGKNELTTEKAVPAWKKFLAQFQNVLVILLLIATAISAALWLYERESALPYEAIAIFAVVLLNAVMGYFQESRAEEAVAALHQMSAAHANVASFRQSTKPSPFAALLSESIARRREMCRLLRSVTRIPPLSAR
jgi:Ca2+-transporting ATPase